MSGKCLQRKPSAKFRSLLDFATRLIKCAIEEEIMERSEKVRVKIKQLILTIASCSSLQFLQPYVFEI